MPKIHDLILVADDSIRQALPIIRSLGRRNIETALLSHAQLAPAVFSRYHPRSYYCPLPRENLHGYLANLIRIVKTRKFTALFPLGDDHLIAISEHRARLASHTELVLPSRRSVSTVFDKSQLLRMAEERKIPTPRTFSAKNLNEVKDLSTRIQYPAVIKPRWSYVWKQTGAAQYTRASYVNSASELVSTYVKVDEDFPQPMIQEYVPGHNVSVAFLFDHGEPKVACCIRVYRAWPNTGGISVLKESVPLDPILLRYASTLLRDLHWHGVAEVEFRIDQRDCIPKLMEINGRFWGSLEVAIESGLDFPYLMYQLSKGETISSAFRYKTGVKFRWLNGDFCNLRATLRGKSPLINMTPPNKLNATIQFLKMYEKNLHYDSFSLSDPLPFFVFGKLQRLSRSSNQR